MHEPRYGPTGAGAVLLELGAGIGALILHVPVELNGAEIEISRSGAPGVPGPPRTHAQVRERRVGGAVGYAALYAGLEAGTYSVWRDERTVATEVTVAGGQVASCRWPVADESQGWPERRVGGGQGRPERRRTRSGTAGTAGG